GTYEQNIEIYQPPYLFTTDSTANVILAPRPSISSLPSKVIYGSSFTVQTLDAANISSVALIRNGSATHAFDMDQRYVGLSFTAGSGALNVTSPPNGNIAPPGYYMLFLVNNLGVPSVAKFVQLGPQPDFCLCDTLIAERYSGKQHELHGHYYTLGRICGDSGSQRQWIAPRFCCNL